MKRRLLRLLDTVGLTSKIVRARLEPFVERHATTGRTLDIGSAHGPYAKHFPNRVSTDIAEGPGVDVVADAHDLSPFPDASFDCVLATEVLEHLHTPERAIREMYRVLAPGGSLVLTTRFIFPLHDVPHDYWRFTSYGLRHLLRDFEIKELVAETGTIGTLAVLYERIGFQCDTFYFKPLGVLWLLSSKLTLLLQRALTKEYGDVTRAERVPAIMASGYYVYAVKK